jgi:signal transduction histidine kinase
MQNAFFHKRFSVLAAAVILAVAATLTWGCGRSVSAAPPVKKVLIIYPTSTAYPFYIDFTNSFQQRLRAETSLNYEFYSESLELLNRPLDENLAYAHAEVMRQKYKNHKPDIIVTNGPFGTRFLNTYCSDIFYDTQIVSYSPNFIDVDSSTTGPNYTYCYPMIEPVKNVELILSLKPSIQKLYVVIGKSESNRRAHDELPRLLAPFTGRLAITYLDDLSLSDLLASTRAIEGQAAILFFDFVQDANGTAVVPVQIIPTIVAEAKVPVFVSYSTHLEKGGGVGGYVLNNNALGREVGERTLAILLGRGSPTKVQALNISEYEFDWRELQRWGIDADKLPPGSVILNKPPSFWETYRWRIIGLTFSVALLVMLLQAGVIALYRQNRRKTEADLLRLDRLNTVGEMAASIGHEVRNPMTTVRGYLQMFMRRAEYAPHRQQFTTMVEELDRANDIISGFLSLAKNKVMELKPGNLNNVINTLSPMLQAEALRTDHDLRIDTGEIPDINMDDKEIRQLILNLVRNAFDAMEAGGRLTIATYARNDHVVLAVSDTGKGIPREVLAKLGTPFLTTKQHGTGLGLPVCYRIAERHGAKVDVKTSPQGTTFSVYFRPLVD